MITRKEIDTLCDLARLGASEEEKETLAHDLEKILTYVQQVQNVVIPEDIQEVYTLSNVMRKDSDPYPPKSFTDVLVDQAPAHEGEYIRVKKVL